MKKFLTVVLVAAGLATVSVQAAPDNGNGKSNKSNATEQVVHDV